MDLGGHCRRDRAFMQPLHGYTGLISAVISTSCSHRTGGVSLIALLWRKRLTVAPLVTALGLIFEFFVPASGRIIAVGAVVFGFATWTVPLLLVALREKPRSSLAGVSFALGIFVVGASFSAIGLWLAFL